MSTARASNEYLKRPYGRVVVPEPDGTFRAEIMEFPGCLATGDTASEALTNLEAVAESWVEATISRGQQVPEPMEGGSHSGKLVVRLGRDLHRRSAYMAAVEGVSLNQFIVSSVAERVGAIARPTMIYAQTASLHTQLTLQSVVSEPPLLAGPLSVTGQFEVTTQASTIHAPIGRFQD